MIDTIKLFVPVPDPSLLAQLEGSLTRFRKEDLKTGEIKFEFFSSNIELGSYHRNVTIRSTKVPAGLFVEFSIAKYEKGNNVEMIYPHDIPKIMEKLYSELCTQVQYELPHFSLWPLYRLDICYNWLLQNKEEALHAIDFIKRIDFPRKKKHVWDTSVMYQGSAYIVKFYVKGPEFQKNDFKFIDAQSPDRAFQLAEYANKILRFEVGLKRAYLMEYFGNNKVYLKDIADDLFIEEMLSVYLGKVFHYINTKTTTRAEVRRLLSENFSKTKALRLYQFYRDYYFDEEMKAMYLQDGLNRSTIYRYKKDLKRIGVGFSVGDSELRKGILEQLIIPSSTTRFALIDSPDTMPI